MNAKLPPCRLYLLVTYYHFMPPPTLSHTAIEYVGFHTPLFCRHWLSYAAAIVTAAAVRLLNTATSFTLATEIPRRSSRRHITFR
jgi:hypothetical protein